MMTTSCISIWKDARTEWAIRWTVMHAVFYALFFYYPPQASIGTYIDWSLPVQLISGGNLGFYNAGWHAYFGVGAAFAMVAAGALLSIVFPFLQDDDLGVAFMVLMLLFAVMTLPVIRHVGVLNNLLSITIVLVVIFTEVFYGPALNFRQFFSVKDIWTQIVQPNAVPAVIFVALSWAVYAIPPWHSGVYQTLQLSSQVTMGIGQSLRAASSLLSEEIQMIEKKKKETETIDEIISIQTKLKLREIANGLLQNTNMAGLTTPIALYGDMGSYEISPSHAAASLPYQEFHRLGRTLDETVFHVSVVLWILGEVLHNSNNDPTSSEGSVVEVHNVRDVLESVIRQMDSAADLADATAQVLVCPRKSYKSSSSTTSSSSEGGETESASASQGGGVSFLEQMAITHPELFGGAALTSSSAMIPTTTAQAKKALNDWKAVDDLDLFNTNKTTTETSSSDNKKTETDGNQEEEDDDSDHDSSTDTQLLRLLLWTITSDLTISTTEKANNLTEPKDSSSSTKTELSSSPRGGGSLVQLAHQAQRLQESWQDSGSFVRMVFRISFLEQIVALAMAWKDGVLSVLGHTKKQVAAAFTTSSNSSTPRQRRRTLERSIQYMVGVVGLFAMATWWEEYSTLLGSSSTGQWTMVAFFVCFRATAEETVNAGILRSTGHVMGAMLSWGMNEAITSNGGRMTIHLIITLVLTWFIPPPFVYPSTISFPWDGWLGGGGVLEGLLTTYHLTSVLVFGTDIASATKARALSQCLGSLAAAVVALVIFPWFAVPKAEAALGEFQKEVRDFLVQKASKSSSSNKEEAMENGKPSSLPKVQSEVHGFVNELLGARRDLGSAREAKGWIPSFVMTIGANQCSQAQRLLNDEHLAKLDGDLCVAAIWGFAVEAFAAKFEALSGLLDLQKLRVSLSNQKYDDAMTLVKETIQQKSKVQKKEGLLVDSPGRQLCTVYIEVLVMKEAAEALKRSRET